MSKLYIKNYDYTTSKISYDNMPLNAMSIYSNVEPYYACPLDKVEIIHSFYREGISSFLNLDFYNQNLNMNIKYIGQIYKRYIDIQSFVGSKILTITLTKELYPIIAENNFNIKVFGNIYEYKPITGSSTYGYLNKRHLYRYVYTKKTSTSDATITLYIKDLTNSFIVSSILFIDLTLICY